MKTVTSLDLLKESRKDLVETFKSNERVTVSEIYESPISFSFRVYVDKKSVNFVQFLKPIN